MNFYCLASKVNYVLARAMVIVADDENANKAQQASTGGGGGYMNSLNQLKSVMAQIAVAFGAVIMAYGVIKFALAFQKMDQQGEHQAVFSIISGGILIGFSALMQMLGVV